MDIGQHPAVCRSDDYCMDFAALGRLHGQLSQHVPVFGIQREPDGFCEMPSTQMELFSGELVCFMDFTEDVQGAQQAGDQKGQQGKDEKQMELKTGTKI